MNLRGWLHRTRHQAFQRCSDLMGQGLDHGVSSLAQSDDQHARIRVQVVEIVADAQNSSFTVHMARKAFSNRRLGQRVLEDCACGLAHLAGIRHAQDYKDCLG